MNRQRNVAVGVFADRQQAQSAVSDLRRASFGEDQIGIIARNGENIGPSDAGELAVQHSRMVEGAAAGMATGAGVGALWALGIAAGVLPAIGPIIAGGILASLAASAAGAAAVGTLVGSLIGLGIPEEEAEEYHAHVVEGRTIVTVKTDERYPEAVQILESHGGHVSFPYSGSVAAARESDAVARGTRSAAVEPVHASDEQSIGEPIESMPVEETTSGVTSRSVRVDRASIGSAKTPSERAGEVPTDARPNEFDRPA